VEAEAEELTTLQASDPSKNSISIASLDSLGSSYFCRHSVDIPRQG